MSLEGKYAELSEGQTFTNIPVAIKEVGASCYFTFLPAECTSESECVMRILSWLIALLSVPTAALELCEGEEKKQQQRKPD